MDKRCGTCDWWWLVGRDRVCFYDHQNWAIKSEITRRIRTMDYNDGTACPCWRKKEEE